MISMKTFIFIFLLISFFYSPHLGTGYLNIAPKDKGDSVLLPASRVFVPNFTITTNKQLYSCTKPMHEVLNNGHFIKDSESICTYNTSSRNYYGCMDAPTQYKPGGFCIEHFKVLD